MTVGRKNYFHRAAHFQFAVPLRRRISSISSNSIQESCLATTNPIGGPHELHRKANLINIFELYPGILNQNGSGTRLEFSMPRTKVVSDLLVSPPVPVIRRGIPVHRSGIINFPLKLGGIINSPVINIYYYIKRGVIPRPGKNDRARVRLRILVEESLGTGGGECLLGRTAGGPKNVRRDGRRP